MKQPFIVLLFALWSFTSLAQFSKEAAFDAALKNIVQKLATRNAFGLQQCIDQKTGVYILYKIGLQDFYSNDKAISFSDSSYPNAPFYDDTKLTKLIYAALPSYDCKKWTKTGTFTDTTRMDHLLSKTARSLNKNHQMKTSAAALNELTKLESISRRVVITGKNDNSLIIYLAFINNKWVLTVIDKLTCDCSV